jgi:hypothetical protein
MIVTVNRIPVPDPIAPKKSAKIVNTPMHIPPKVAAVMINDLNFLYVPSLVDPLMNIPCYLRFLATYFGPCPETSIQVLLKRAHAKINKIFTSNNEYYISQ